MTLKTINLFLADASATGKLGYLLGQHLSPGTVILLKGELGSGKTTLIQGLGKSLGITEPIASPTFTMINEYTEVDVPLYHLDLYRLSPEGVSALYPEIYWEGAEKTPGITAIEWSEHLPYKPSQYIEIQLTYNLKQGRNASLKLIGLESFDLEQFGEIWNKAE
ncbi:MAG: tRNA (adenosine(37)-N6)-threonylcarbamoyltransferase complex ATPase subunit type 1 TsaE [Xenococcaceae cyanobacterium MO_207.B15]|nr:tRNA (adenosine(37)-N6)-threonylcarbamoyltransferase complex ATPase subunit type 1 TsaE [Xenococcaceae cyanobacterium MO_207.B15]MDJ0745548.1 tRNA (adenosine(37)-N6)-threonylcarbamoyltransferase complex ATPase subunit type 1 TsaE [Xenococcaceae cyanobacterium MO_167.B27]